MTVTDMEGNAVEYVVTGPDGEELIHRPGWPTPIAKDFEWVVVDHVCEHCGASNPFHDQPQEWLDTQEGVKWECNSCNKINQLGGHEPATADTFVLECGECGRTYQPGDPPVEINYDRAAGTFVCAEEIGGCGTPNRYVGHADQGSSDSGQVKA